MVGRLDLTHGVRRSHSRGLSIAVRPQADINSPASEEGGKALR